MTPARTPLFLDTEFTGLEQQGELISLAIVADEPRWFYAEFTDYNPVLLTDWHRENVLPYLYFGTNATKPIVPADCILMEGDSGQIVQALREWLTGFNSVEIWADVLAYDWVFFCELFGGALHIPQNIFYMPMDFATLLRVRNLDPDTDRVALSGLPADTKRHNALTDAQILNRCFYELMAKSDGQKK